MQQVSSLRRRSLNLLLSSYNNSRRMRFSNYSAGGYGIETYADGSLAYAGTWANGQRNGKGHQYSQEGNPIYSGTWARDLYEGEGSKFDEIGLVSITGSFSQGLAHGKVRQFDKNSRKVFEGFMEMGLRSSGEIWIYHGDSIDWTTQIYCPNFSDNSVHGNCVKTTRSDKTVQRYEGFINNGAEEGEGKYFENGILIYQGTFHLGLYDGDGNLYDNTGHLIYTGSFAMGKFHGPGKRTLSGTYNIRGDFEYGDITHGRVFKGDKIMYEGKVDKKFNPEGEGTMFFREFMIFGHWTNCKLDGTIPVRLTCGNQILEGSIDTSKQSRITSTVFFTEATYTELGVIQFQGSCHFHVKTKYLCKCSGTFYVNGKRRVSGKFQGNDILIEAYFDEENDLRATPASTFEYVTEFDGEWPTLHGTFNVWSGSQLLYVANFKDGAISNPITIANSLPLIHRVVSGEPLDIVSMEQIPFNSVGFELNSHHHVVSNETLQLLRSTKTLRRHPCTRSPVLRISRVLFLKSS